MHNNKKLGPKIVLIYGWDGGKLRFNFKQDIDLQIKKSIVFQGFHSQLSTILFKLINYSAKNPIFNLHFLLK
jgi:hypothetical protein